jgi:hypothetical protein
MPLKNIFRFFGDYTWYERFGRKFWRYPDRLMAVKATLVMAVVAIPLEIAGLSFFAVTLSLGVLAGALSETDDHPKARVPSLILKVKTMATSAGPWVGFFHHCFYFGRRHG